jgi:hypothetical protein
MYYFLTIQALIILHVSSKIALSSAWEQFSSFPMEAFAGPVLLRKIYAGGYCFAACAWLRSSG